jgi:deoxyribonuclease-1
MDATYKRYNMSKSQKQLMNAWNRMYPVSDWECKRAKSIRAIQGSANKIMEIIVIKIKRYNANHLKI